MKKPDTLLTARELCLMALLTTVLFLQEELLSFLPNIQLTVLLMLLYARLFGFVRTSLMITVYLLLDCAFMGAVNPLSMSFQWLGWMLIPLLSCTLLKNTEDSLTLAFAGAGFALLYSWCMIVPGVILLHVSVKAYLLSDILFEVLLAASSFLSILLLYEPLEKRLRKLLRQL